MLESFEIINFRLFQHLQVKKLSRVNLIVGKNNSGKSSFLEALELYISNASPTVFLQLIEFRQENWNSNKFTPQLQNPLNNSLRHLFFEHKLSKLREKGISLGEVKSTKLAIGLAAYQLGNFEQVRVVTENRLSDFDLELDEYPNNFVLYLAAEENGKIKRIFELNSDSIDIMINYSRVLSDFKYLWQTVSTENMSNQNLSALWDLTSLDSDLKSEVIEGLRLIDKRVTGVGFVDDDSKERDRIPLVTMEGVKEPLPLKSMGDGVTRLFHIILALVNAKNGILLIDEFENGLHWSVQPKVWNVVFQVAEKLNVQVFATTHSRDCISGFDEAWNTYPELGAFLRLDLKDGTVKATEYTSETLNDSLEMDVEVR